MITEMLKAAEAVEELLRASDEFETINVNISLPKHIWKVIYEAEADGFSKDRFLSLVSLSGWIDAEGRVIK